MVSLPALLAVSREGLGLPPCTPAAWYGPKRGVRREVPLCSPTSPRDRDLWARFWLPLRGLTEQPSLHTHDLPPGEEGRARQLPSPSPRPQAPLPPTNPLDPSKPVIFSGPHTLPNYAVLLPATLGHADAPCPVLSQEILPRSSDPAPQSKGELASWPRFPSASLPCDSHRFSEHQVIKQKN